jgi:hypothetical protein
MVRPPALFLHLQHLQHNCQLCVLQHLHFSHNCHLLVQLGDFCDVLGEPAILVLFIEADPTLNESLVNVADIISILTPSELATCIGAGLANFEPVGRCP